MPRCCAPDEHVTGDFRQTFDIKCGTVCTCSLDALLVMHSTSSDNWLHGGLALNPLRLLRPISLPFLHS